MRRDPISLAPCPTGTGSGRAEPVGGRRLPAPPAQELQLLGETEEGPRQPASPSAEWRVALLRIGAAIASVVNVENAFVCGAAAHIVGVAVLAIENRVASSRFRMLEETLEQRNFLIALAHENV